LLLSKFQLTVRPASCAILFMRLGIEVSAKQLIELKQLLAGKDEYLDIYNQLVSAVADIDDSQSDEVPTEGDNEIIKRIE
jgi:hypothetical protein